MTDSETTHTATSEPPVASRAGIFVAAVLCVLLVPWAAAVGWFGIFAVNTGVCDPDCNAVGISLSIAIYIPPVIALIAIVLTIFGGIRRRRLAWIYPLAAFFIVLVPYHVGHAISTIVNHTPWL
ncbi:hypothetical protein [Glaciihabitans sp. dw_435]|uniref:hypothetical protein n=1 Tax=Glaciihabitans sp. dw_435 TaxID=2720081 RepID=UPI001BD4A813|nr:hypothetical protein [Glaciihabitans sp. dw_435]